MRAFVERSHPCGRGPTQPSGRGRLTAQSATVSHWCVRPVTTRSGVGLWDSVSLTTSRSRPGTQLTSVDWSGSPSWTGTSITETERRIRSTKILSVMYISTHQYPHYPGTGGTREVGHGPGVGFTVNFPMSSGFGDAEYVTAFDMVIAPILAAYNPQMILVSAGFDAHHLDPLGGMGLTEDGFEQILQILMHLAAELCSDRIILALEGGYSLQALPDSVKRLLTCLAKYDPETATVPMPPPLEDLSKTFRSRLFDVMNTQRQHWPSLPLL